MAPNFRRVSKTPAEAFVFVVCVRQRRRLPCRLFAFARYSVSVQSEDLPARCRSVG
jgi:hypothetical protein